jgi:carbon storage regulator
MLVLTRKVGESIRIGDDVEVLVTAIDQNKVKIGIRSPRHVPVYREELYKRIQEENRQAANVKMGDLDHILKAYSEEGNTNAPDEPQRQRDE